MSEYQSSWRLRLTKLCALCSAVFFLLFLYVIVFRMLPAEYDSMTPGLTLFHSAMMVSAIYLAQFFLSLLMVIVSVREFFDRS